MKQVSFFIFLLVIVTSCQAQPASSATDIFVGGPCEGCEAIYEYGDQSLVSNITLPGFEENEPKLKVSGTVFKKDGKTPASNVIIYVYQTNRSGVYEHKNRTDNWERRHGFIRGWLKTNQEGKYTFFTFRPAAYPNGREAEHIHFTVKEPGKSEYYIDSIVFEDDPLLTKSRRVALENRGGSGIVSPKLQEGILQINRDIILGYNIPDYPE